MNHTDDRIDQILHALAHTTPPAGLEQRINARITQRLAEADAQPGPFFTRLISGNPRTSAHTKLPLYSIVAALLLLAAGYLALTLRHPAPQIADLPQASPANATASGLDTPHATTMAHSAFTHSTVATGSRLHPLAPATTQAAASSPDDPDAIALAETLAPSRPTPPLPLTAQETLLASSTRRGQPIEVAELETRRHSALIAIADAREQSRIREYIHGLLGPLATAQALTPSSQPDDAKPVADAESPSSK